MSRAVAVDAAAADADVVVEARRDAKVATAQLPALTNRPARSAI
jgi:hypothetical protein